jgi:tetratricopeptide (TPR) repeat protein
VSATADPKDCPYVGLDPFESAYADFFFGRRQESKIIADHVLARPVTVLYGPSGVGKSSILNVGLPAALKRIADAERDDAQPRDSDANPVAPDAGFDVRWMHDWQDPEKAERQLTSWATEPFRRPVLVILDQFEEYFLYRGPTRVSALDRAIGSLVARRDLPLHLLFGVRDDALHQLDRLRAFIPGILETTIELRGLNEAGVREAIIGPIDRYNENYRTHGPAITVEEGLVASLVRQLKEADTAFNKGRTAPPGERRVELPYLQLALTKLWMAEGGAGAVALHESTLNDRLGGVGRIVREHVNGVMKNLGVDEQALCAKMFDRLVTALGGKIAYPTAALATADVVGANVSEQAVEAVLNKLTGREERILKPVMTSNGEGFEIFHDVLGLPVLEWKRDFDARRVLRRRLLSGLVAAASILAIVGTSLGVLVYDRVQLKIASDNYSLAVGAAKGIMDEVIKGLDGGKLTLANASSLLDVSDNIVAKVKGVSETPQTKEAHAEFLVERSDIYIYLGKMPDALKDAQSAKELADSLVASDPSNNDWQLLLYRALFRLGDVQDILRNQAEAKQSYQQALDIVESIFKKTTGNLDAGDMVAFIYNKLGDLALEQPDYDTAKADYETAVSIMERLVKEDPSNLGYARDLASSYFNQAQLLVTQGKSEDALSLHEKVLELRRKELANDPNNPVFLSHVAVSLVAIGKLQVQLSRPDEAVKNFREAVKDRQIASEVDITNRVYQSSLATALDLLGDALKTIDNAEAVENYNKALSIRQGLVAADPDNEQWQRALKTLQNKIGKLAAPN